MSNQIIELSYNFKEVERGKLYRSSQPDKNFLSYVKDSYDIKTIVSLRGNLENEEPETIKEKGMSLIHIPLRPFSGPNKKKITDFLNLFKEEKNLPVLLHCRRGKDRTGIMTAIFRSFYQNWPEKEIFKEIDEKGVNLYWKIVVKWNWRRIKEMKKNENFC
jgi:protein tyrosine/serine phosphatase